MAIVSQEAKASFKSASELLLTESDRKSNGEFALKARKYLQERKVAVDLITSCRADRPPGLKLINLDQIPSASSLYIITEWTVDVQQTIMKFDGVEDGPKDR